MSTRTQPADVERPAHGRIEPSTNAETAAATLVELQAGDSENASAFEVHLRLMEEGFELIGREMRRYFNDDED